MGMFVSLDRLVEQVRDGMSLAIPNDHAGVAMAATAALIARGPRNLDVVCVPIGGMQADMLIGSGLVASIETSAVTLGEAGGAPRFTAGIRAGAFRIRDATCPALLAGFVAGQKGVPFMPIRGIIGSDLVQARPDWKISDNPYAGDDRSSWCGDPARRRAVSRAGGGRFGNVRIGRQTELAAMAHASKATLVTVERVSDTSLLADENQAAGVLPRFT